MVNGKELAEVRLKADAEAFSYNLTAPRYRLDDQSIASIAEHSGLSVVGRMLVDDIRNSQAEFGPASIPALADVVGRLPARTIALLHQYANVSVEYLALLLPYSPLFRADIVEIWRNARIPDVEFRQGTAAVRVGALIVKTSGFFFFEYRDVEDLISNPFYTMVGGKWDSPRLRIAGERYGIGYQLVTNEEIGQVGLENISKLQRCYLQNYYRTPEPALMYITQRVETSRVVSWRDLNRENVSDEAIVCAIALGLAWYPIREWIMPSADAFVYLGEDAFVQHKGQRR